MLLFNCAMAVCPLVWPGPDSGLGVSVGVGLAASLAASLAFCASWAFFSVSTSTDALAPCAAAASGVVGYFSVPKAADALDKSASAAVAVFMAFNFS